MAMSPKRQNSARARHPLGVVGWVGHVTKRENLGARTQNTMQKHKAKHKAKKGKHKATQYIFLVAVF